MQLIESLMGNWCAEKCTQTDATIFKKVDIDSISLELENMGLNKHGYRRMYNGITGEFIDSLIFIGPTYYQRLQKFTIDTQYAISNGPSDKLLIVRVRCKILASRSLIGNTFKLRESLEINAIVLKELLKNIPCSGKNSDEEAKSIARENPQPIS